MSIIRDGFQSADLDAPVTAPTLNLDFANSQSLDPRITFTRGSIGTFVNKNGLIETAAANVPRFDYDPISGECRGLLIEESRSNYANQSFVAINSTLVSSNDTTYQPILGGSVYRFRIGTSGLQFYIPLFNAPGYSAINQTDTLTFYLKSDSPVTISSPYSSNASTSGLYFSNGSTTTFSVSISTSPAAFGFTRYTLTYTAQQLNGNNITRARINVSGALGTDFYVFGAQWESRVTFPTSYIPTTTSSVTRSADNADMTGSNFTSWANSSVGTFVIRGRGGQSSTQTLRGRFVGLDVTASAISLDGASTKVAIWDGGTNIVVTNNSADVLNRNSNIAASFDGTLRRIVLNGVASSGISRRNINTIFTQISLGKNGSNNNYLNGTLSRVAYYPRQLNDAQMLYLTT